MQRRWQLELRHQRSHQTMREAVRNAFDRKAAHQHQPPKTLDAKAAQNRIPMSRPLSSCCPYWCLADHEQLSPGQTEEIEIDLPNR